jgi:hypothetical protein
MMDLEIPDEIVRALETKVPADQVEMVVRRALAVGLYKAGELPWEKAVRLARMDETGFEALAAAWAK